MKWLKNIVAVIAVVIIAWVALAVLWPPYSWHQKITVTVETPDGSKTGSSITSAWADETNFLDRQLGYAYRSGASGEAVVVDLGGGRYLFALLGGIEYIAQNVFYDLLPKGISARYRKLSRLRMSRPIPRKYYPLLVTFGDINDPKTVKKVDPDNLAAAFGPGYRLKSITLEITDEPVTRGKVEKLGFMKQLKKQSTLSGLEIYDNRFADPIYYLTNKAFVRGLK